VILTKKDIVNAYADKVTVQSYEKKPVIEGVKIVDLTTFIEDGGDFTEVARLNEKGEHQFIEGLKVRQMNYSVIVPGVIKAFHLHFRQNEAWYVPPYSRALVGLFDVRKSSKTKGVSMRVVLGGGKSRLLYIPMGVAHGVANVWKENTILLYFVDQQFNIQDPDERRLPWDIIGKELWQIQKG